MRIKELCEQANKDAKNKGFWEEKRDIGTLLMLVVSELAEALEADRKYGIIKPDMKDIECLKDENDFVLSFEKNVKDTFGDELADAMIRIADVSEGYGIDLEKHIRLKLKYNRTRKYKHEKSY
jgi:NTP pyrophosphatase (non-canonical NTP hydrolase)